MAYKYQVINEFRSGVPQTPFGTVGPFLMLAAHDTEGGVGLAGARGTLQFLIDRADRNASYHELWCWDVATRTFTVLRIVPATSAAHSIGPQPPPYGAYEPDALVRNALGDKWRDPNRYVYAVSIAGKVANVNAWSMDSDFVAACNRRAAEVVVQFGVKPVLGEHFRFQPGNRTDWGRLLAPKMGGLETGKETDMQFWKPVQEDWYTVAKTATTLGTIFYDGAGAKKEFTTRERVQSTAESSDARYRQVKYAGKELLVVDARGNDKEGPGLLSIAGTRVPSSPNYGFPPPVTVIKEVEVIKEVIKTVEVPTGITQDQVNAAHDDGVVDGEATEKSRLRKLLGL